jgi:hypothetical protein
MKPASLSPHTEHVHPAIVHALYRSLDILRLHSRLQKLERNEVRSPAEKRIRFRRLVLCLTRACLGKYSGFSVN